LILSFVLLDEVVQWRCTMMTFCLGKSRHVTGGRQMLHSAGRYMDDMHQYFTVPYTLSNVTRGFVHVFEEHEVDGE
jgi:hypothetical protein